MNQVLIEECFERIRNGYSIANSKDKGGLPISRIETIANGDIDFNRVGYADIFETKGIEEYLVKTDDILMSHINSVSHLGKTAIFKNTDQELIHGMNLILLRTNEKLFAKYAYYFFNSNRFKSNLSSIIKKAVNQASFSTSNFKKLQIPLPPLATQRKIAAALDKADAIRKRSQLILSKYDQLAQSVFLEMFGDPVKNEKGWEMKSLSSFGKITSGSTPSRKIDTYYNGNIPWVKTGEVNGKTIFSTSESITEEGLANSSCKLYPIKSILIAMYGQGKTRGQVGILGIEATTNQACAVIPPSNKINSIFLFEQLKHRYDDLRSLARGGNQANLNCGLIKDYKIIFPPIVLQTKFASIIEQIEKQKSQTQLELDRAEELFQSLLKRAFTGELFPETRSKELTHT